METTVPAGFASWIGQTVSTPTTAPDLGLGSSNTRAGGTREGSSHRSVQRNRPAGVEDSLNRCHRGVVLQRLGQRRDVRYLVVAEAARRKERPREQPGHALNDGKVSTPASSPREQAHRTHAPTLDAGNAEPQERRRIKARAHSRQTRGGSSLPQVDSLQAFPRRVAPDSLELPLACVGAPERVRLQLCLPGARCVTAAFVRGWW